MFFVIMIISFFWGICLSFFGISMEALRYSRIVIATSVFLLSGEFNKKKGVTKGKESDAQESDIALTPLAFYACRTGIYFC
jgi:small neutral amino acid transporter SnatA (MarC family)